MKIERHKQIIEAIKQAKEAQGVYSSDIAKHIDRPTSSVEKWMTGDRRPHFETLVLICEYLGLSINLVEKS